MYIQTGNRNFLFTLNQSFLQCYKITNRELNLLSQFIQYIDSRKNKSYEERKQIACILKSSNRN